MLGAVGMTTLAAVPVFLVSAESVRIRTELQIDEARFGLAASCFFASAAAAAVCGGRGVDRLGRRHSTVLAGTLACAGGLLLALTVHSYWQLLLALVVLGMANAALQLTANLTLASAIPRGRQGTAFGIKQSAVPLAIMVGGLSVPTLGATVGWRWPFGFTALAGVAVACAGWGLPHRTSSARRQTSLAQGPPRNALVWTACGMALASAAVNALGAFIAAWGFEAGLTPSQAGFLMAVGSGLSVVARIATGYRADRRNGRNLVVVRRQITVGALALLLISFGGVPLLWAAALLAFAVGWAWPGLLMFGVVRMGRSSPAAASGTIQAGAFVGGALGPALFGVTVSTWSFAFAWQCSAACMLLAAALIGRGRRAFVRDLSLRPLDVSPGR